MAQLPKDGMSFPDLPAPSPSEVLLSLCRHGTKDRPDNALILISKGAKLDAVDNMGKSALVWAVNLGHLKTASLLLNRPDAPDINAMDKTGNYLLQWAVQSHSTEMVKYLLDRGAKPDCLAEHLHSTPLMYAADKGETAIVWLLLEYGANTALKDNTGMTALDYATRTGKKELIDLLDQAERHQLLQAIKRDEVATIRTAVAPMPAMRLRRPAPRP